MRRCIDRPDGGTEAGAASSASRDIFHCETREEVAGCEATVDELERCIRDAFTAESRAYFTGLISEMRGQGCEGVVLGCTEVPLIITEENSPLPVLDSTRLLARAALRASLE